MRNAILLLICVLAGALPADAQTCTASISGANFGAITSLTPALYRTTTSLSVTCTGFQSTDTIAICPDLGVGSGGSNGASQRLLSGSGGGALTFQIYSDNSTTSPWGSVGSYGATTVPLLSQTGNGSQSKTLYLSLNTTGGSTTPDTYTSSFTPIVKYGAVLTTAGGCSGATLAGTTSAPFTVQASLSKSCTVNVTQNVDFGSLSTLNAGANATGALSVQCTNSTVYDIALDNGTGGGLSPDARKMKSTAGNTITYALYQDASHAKPWGSTSGAGGNTEGGTGTGSFSAVTVYGRIAPQQTPAAGTYSDSVIVTVTY